MRLRITLDDELVQAIDGRVGTRRRSAFIAQTVRQALEDEDRWALVESAVGSIHERHDWDRDPAAWVRAQRRMLA